MIYAQEDYIALLKNYLPPGPAWEGQNLKILLSGIADQFYRAHKRADDIVTDSNPLTVAEQLKAREDEAGLPDGCSDPKALTFVERRSSVLLKWTDRGGQSRQYYFDLARALGFRINYIVEFRPFRAGENAVGEPLTNDDEAANSWAVGLDSNPYFYFRAGHSTTNEPLLYSGNLDLECQISKRKPAHTTLYFLYDQDTMSFRYLTVNPEA